MDVTAKRKSAFAGLNLLNVDGEVDENAVDLLIAGFAPIYYFDSQEKFFPTDRMHFLLALFKEIHKILRHETVLQNEELGFLNNSNLNLYLERMELVSIDDIKFSNANAFFSDNGIREYYNRYLPVIKQFEAVKKLEWHSYYNGHVFDELIHENGISPSTVVEASFNPVSIMINGCHEKGAIIQYNLYYATNGLIPVFDNFLGKALGAYLFSLTSNIKLLKSKMGFHSGDEESIEIILRHNKKLTTKFEIVGVNLYGHGKLSAHLVDDINFVNGTHTMIYVARNTHASYIKPVTINLNLDIADGKGQVFAPSTSNIKNTCLEFRGKNAPESFIKGGIGVSENSPSVPYDRRSGYDDTMNKFLNNNAPCLPELLDVDESANGANILLSLVEEGFNIMD